jgi:hypothetical protein
MLACKLHVKAVMRTYYQSFVRNETRNPMKRILLAASTGVVLACSGGAMAGIQTFTFSGTAASDGRAENGTATFNFVSTTELIITLTNTGGAGQVGGISSEITGVGFTLSTVPGPSTLNSVMAPGGSVDCSTGTCITTTPAVGSTPYNWAIAGTNTVFLGAVQLHPYAITNGNVTATDGNTNGQHNPMLMGPVTYDITLSGLTSIPTVTTAVMQFGTNTADTQLPSSSSGGPNTSGPVPEPSSTALALLGLALLSGVLLRRKYIAGAHA